VPPQQEVASLPAHLEGLQIPEKILQKHIVSNNLSPVTQGLIKWSGLDISLATWEDLEALQQCFPRAPAWGQAGSYQGGNVSTTVTADQDQVTGRVATAARVGPTRSSWVMSGSSLLVLSCVCVAWTRDKYW